MESGHKTIELSAQAALDPKDKWQDAQSQLYTELGEQLKALWISKTSGQTTKIEDSTTAQSEHHCVEHGVEFKRYEKEGKVWYAHKAYNNKWCRER